MIICFEYVFKKIVKKFEKSTKKTCKVVLNMLCYIKYKIHILCILS